MRGQRRESGIIEDNFFISKEELDKIIIPYIQEDKKIQSLEEYSDEKDDIYCSSMGQNFEE